MVQLHPLDFLPDDGVVSEVRALPPAPPLPPSMLPATRLLALLALPPALDVMLALVPPRPPRVATPEALPLPEVPPGLDRGALSPDTCGGGGGALVPRVPDETALAPPEPPAPPAEPAPPPATAASRSMLPPAPPPIPPLPPLAPPLPPAPSAPPSGPLTPPSAPPIPVSSSNLTPSNVTTTTFVLLLEVPEIPILKTSLTAKVK